MERKPLSEIDHGRPDHTDCRPLLLELRTAQPRCAAARRSYRVDHDEESIETMSRLAWRRVASFIHLPGIGQHRATHEVVPMDPADLDAALENDRTSHDGFAHSPA
jgi:hypothetical protein